MASCLSKTPKQAADEAGLLMVTPAGNELFVDIDDDASLEHMDAMMAVLASNAHPMRETKRTVSNGGNTHVYLDAGRELSPVERIAWQAVLGSDLLRELLSLLRVEANDPERPATVFFEKGGA